MSPVEQCPSHPVSAHQLFSGTSPVLQSSPPGTGHSRSIGQAQYLGVLSFLIKSVLCWPPALQSSVPTAYVCPSIDTGRWWQYCGLISRSLPCFCPHHWHPCFRHWPTGPGPDLASHPPPAVNTYFRSCSSGQLGCEPSGF